MKKPVEKLVAAALCLALCLVLPFLTGQIPQIGSALCPMHIPVLLCGFVCGWQWGLIVGFAAPILRSLSLGMPPMFPTAVSMAFELAAYGAATGILYKILPKKKWCIYCALISAMIIGRLVWGTARFIMSGLDVNKFGLSAFWTGAVTSAIPGIILQIVFIPLIIMSIEKFIKNR